MSIDGKLHVEKTDPTGIHFHDWQTCDLKYQLVNKTEAGRIGVHTLHLTIVFHCTCE